MCVRRPDARREARAAADFEWHGRFISFTRDRAINAIGMARVCARPPALPTCVCTYLRMREYASFRLRAHAYGRKLTAVGHYLGA